MTSVEHDVMTWETLMEKNGSTDCSGSCQSR